VPTAGVSRPRALPPAAGLVYAEATLRAVAFAIDSALLAVIWQWPLGLLSSAVQVLVYSSATFEPGPVADLIPVAEAAIIVGGNAVLVVYFWRVFRATPGQMLLGLFVLRADGRRLSVGRALLRWAVVFGPPTLVAFPLIRPLPFGLDIPDLLLRDLSLLIASIPVLWLLLLGLSIVRDERGRGLHDRLAGSVVVRREGSPS
jgi:uncharacterized RDD family membrane protein YckC